MCITEEKLVDRYGQGNPHEMFMLIYKNYEVFLNLVESYEAGLFNRITYRYINKEQKLEKIAEEEDLAYPSIKNLIAVTRKTLEQRTIPFFGEKL